MESPTQMIRQSALPFLEVKTGADKIYAVRPHSHETLSLGFVEKGSSTILCHPLEFSMKQGTAILIPPETIHLCQPDDPEKFIFKMLYISPQWLDKNLGTNHRSFTPGTILLTEETRARATLFFKEFQHKDRLMDETNAILFLDYMLFTAFALPQGPDISSRAVSPQKMERVKSYLDRRFTRDIQLQDLADLTGQSKYAVLRQFKSHWQITPHAYVVNKRINMAKTLLKKGHSVADTAVSCGFFDQSHFIKTFKNFTGIRPSAYRE